jgi:hypothetical protein
MRILLLTNIALQWVIVALLARVMWGDRLGRLSAQWNTTFFGKMRCGFEVYLWERPHQEVPNSGRVVFSFNWRDPKTVKDYPYIKARKWALPAPWAVKKSNV